MSVRIVGERIGLTAQSETDPPTKSVPLPEVGEIVSDAPFRWVAQHPACPSSKSFMILNMLNTVSREEAEEIIGLAESLAASDDVMVFDFLRAIPKEERGALGRRALAIAPSKGDAALVLKAIFQYPESQRDDLLRLVKDLPKSEIPRFLDQIAAPLSQLSGTDRTNFFTILSSISPGNRQEYALAVLNQPSKSRAAALNFLKIVPLDFLELRFKELVKECAQIIRDSSNFDILIDSALYDSSDLPTIWQKIAAACKNDPEETLKIFSDLHQGYFSCVPTSWAAKPDCQLMLSSVHKSREKNIVERIPRTRFDLSLSSPISLKGTMAFCAVDPKRGDNSNPGKKVIATVSKQFIGEAEAPAVDFQVTDWKIKE